MLGPAAPSAVAAAEKAAEAGAGRRQPGDRGPAAARVDPAARRRRAAAAPPAAAHRAGPPGIRAADGGRDRLPTLFPTALGEYLAPGAARPRAPGGHDRVRAVLRHRRRSRTGRARRPWPSCCTSVVSTVEAALEAEGVTLLATDLDTDGGKFFLGSGVPSTREDDEGRMLRALRRIADADLPLPAAARRQPRPRLRGRGRRRRARGLLRDGRHDQHGGPDHGHRPAGRRSTRTPAVLDHSRTRFAVDTGRARSR